MFVRIYLHRDTYNRKKKSDHETSCDKVDYVLVNFDNHAKDRIASREEEEEERLMHRRYRAKSSRY